MKRTLIGGFVMLGGLFITMTMIIAGAIYAPHMTSWSGKSKLWYAVFGGRQYGDENVDSLFLGFPFILGVTLTIGGLVILCFEYYETIEKNKE
ncbi:hypothetical protein GLW00_13195 [Halobacillus litoralis]|uniref:Uncharacterized protein n=1 Tax=Halobacillus litoralis TaxID=45668 RepID=A0A845FDW2_9BACI|nr:hypothetical protein [Halobacillus litoralis]MYL71816.1 hypothetical protein [Halobacillus litoralis]